MTNWRVAKSLLTLRDQVNTMYPNRDKSNDGTIGDERHAASKSEHNPDANGVVRAMDISNDPVKGIASQKLAEILVANRDPRILYIISNKKIISSEVSPWVWRPYTGTNPHDHHVHISVVSDPKLYDDTSNWQLGTQPTPVVEGRFTKVTATEFGGKSDPNTSAYDNHVITDTEFGVALPARVTGKKVKVYKDGKSVVCSIVDVGPWNTNDPYWTTNSRPQAETGKDTRGRKTNLAGIDLTTAAAKAIGLSGKGLVDWEFIEASNNKETKMTETTVKAVDKTPVKTTDKAGVQQEVAQVKTFDTAPVEQKEMGWLDTILGGSLLQGKKTVIGITGAVASTVAMVTGAFNDYSGVANALPTLLTLFSGFAGLGLAAKLERGLAIAQQVRVLLSKLPATKGSK